MNVYRIDPLSDPRWADYVERSSQASVFHTPGWLEALRRTYGYAPAVYTTSPPATRVHNGLVLCEIHSWLTGRRLVSVPFADHCQPLFPDRADRDAVVGELQRRVQQGSGRYLEIRPLTPELDASAGLTPSDSFCFHSLDLARPPGAIFRAFHKSSIQQTIRRAEREGLRIDSGTSQTSLAAFYDLLLLTRRRHQLPPQPIEWFKNLIHCLGDRVRISVASKDGRPLASILTLRHRDTLVYKYGASDASVHNLGAMPLLLWNAIADAAGSGISRLDLGRSDADQAGLIRFKDRLAADRSTLTYLRYPARQLNRGVRRGARAARRLLSFLPDRFLKMTGETLYRHLG